MSAIVFAGSAQFAAVAIFAGGGTIGAAVAAGLLRRPKQHEGAAAAVPGTTS